MGKRDRRHSLKMNQRKAKAKKKIRLKKPKSAKALAAAAAPVKKPRATKASAASDAGWSRWGAETPNPRIDRRAPAGERFWAFPERAVAHHPRYCS